MTLSVVMCCYNGEKYIQEQMDSLKNQSRKADEVIIIDDCSKDDTVQIIKNYIQQNRLHSWTLIENRKNKGWKENFMFGIRQAKGEVIFPCDQDDIWNLEKLEKMSLLMEQNNKILALSSNYTPYYEGEEHRKVDNIFTKAMKFDESCEKIELSEKALYIYRPGCVMALRKKLFEIAEQYKFEDYPHDALFWRTALFLDGLYLYNFSSIKFRRHNSNASDAVRHKKEEKLADINYYIKVSRFLEKMVRDYNQGKEKIELLEKIISFMEKRKKFYETGKLKYYLQLVGKYRKYYITDKAMAGDFIICKRG